MLYGKNVGTQHSVRNMALGKFWILFTFGKVKVIVLYWKVIVLYWTKIYHNDDPYRHKTHPMCYTQTAYICMQNFAAVHRAVSEEIAYRHVSQLSIII